MPKVLSNGRDLLKRHEGNPILTAADWPSTVNAVFNPGAIRFGDETLLLTRVEDRTGLSQLTVARSADGYSNWQIDADRGMHPDTGSWAEHWGIEDPRITEIDGLFHITYVAVDDPFEGESIGKNFRPEELLEQLAGHHSSKGHRNPHKSGLFGGLFG